MNAKEARRKLADLGIEPPPYHAVCRLTGDTFRIFAGDPAYIDRAGAVLRKAGYWARADLLTEVASMLLFNLSGTEWQDGMIPENLAALPLREEPPQQLTMFDEEGAGDE